LGFGFVSLKQFKCYGGGKGRPSRDESVNLRNLIAGNDSLLLVKDVQRCSYGCNSSIMCAVDKDLGWVSVPKIGFMLHLPGHV
jgi:hypothetical protein